MQVAILIITMAGGFAVVQWSLKNRLDRQYEQRALAVAETLASQPAVIHGVEHGRPGGAIQRLAMAAMGKTGARFVVITNSRGIRYSHPNPALIGKPVYSDPEPPSTEPFRTGKPWTGIQRGTLGRTPSSTTPILTARGKAPIYDGHKLVGEVSVGFPLYAVTDQALGALPGLAVYLLAVLAVGVLAALALSRRLKRQTCGLELGEIAALFQEREAMLHGIREGVLGYDKTGRVLLANDTAQRLLQLPVDFVGRPVRELLPPGRLRDVVSGEVIGSDLLVLTGDRVLVTNRMPIRHDHRRHLGWVVTIHDRTEPESLKRELDEAIGLTEALRAQSHEFANRLHTLVGLVELEQYEEAVRFVTDVTTARDELAEQLKTAFRDPKLVALVLAKHSLADERGVQLRAVPDCHVDANITCIGEVLTVVGNLVDNAIEATAQVPGPRWVEFTVVSYGADLMIRVRDSGPGVPEDARDAIFTDGFTSKSSPTGARRGLGLALVRQVVERRGGMISVGADCGAVFTAVLPCSLEATSRAEPHRPGQLEPLATLGAGWGRPGTGAQHPAVGAAREEPSGVSAVTS